MPTQVEGKTCEQTQLDGDDLIMSGYDDRKTGELVYHSARVCVCVCVCVCVLF